MFGPTTSGTGKEQLPGSGRLYAPVGPRSTQLQPLFVVVMILVVLAAPLFAIVPYRPATWVGWLLLYGVGVPLYFLVVGLLEFATTPNGTAGHAWPRTRQSRSRALLAAVAVVVLLALCWAIVGGYVSHHFERW